MELKDLPQKPKLRFPRRLSLALTEETYQKINQLRAQRKDVASFIRDVIDKAISKVKAG